MLSDRQSARGRNQMDLHVISVDGETYTCRHWHEGKPQQVVKAANSLTGARLGVPRGKVNVGRTHGDSQGVVEVWL